MEKKKPCIMLIDELLSSFMLAIDEYESVVYKFERVNEPFLLKGTFVYAFAIFESLLSDCLTYYLCCFPEKMSFKDTSLRKYKDAIINESLIKELKDSIIEDYVISISYNSLNDYMKLFCDILEIDYNFSDEIDNLYEKKETRNLLIHNGLRINRKYQLNCKNRARPGSIGQQLDITPKYTVTTILSMIKILKKIVTSIQNKYNIYSKEKALRSIWEYFFDSPIMQFDDYWIVKDGVVAGFNNPKAKRHINSLSSSEKAVLILWIQNFSPEINDIYFEFKDMHATMNVTEEYAYITELISKHPHLFQGG